VQSIYRYPVKGLSPERLLRAPLGVGATLPGDRLYAIENGPPVSTRKRRAIGRRSTI
jgi:uncharacterized protein YcbX